MNIAMILSGGVGKRFGALTPKQYQDLLGKPVVDYVVNATLQSDKIDKTVVVCMDYIKSNYICEKIMVFDAMRPFVTKELIDLYMDKLDEYEVVATCQKIVDSLGCLDFLECDRSRYYILQSPEAFRFDLLYNHFDAFSTLVEAYQQLPLGTTLYKHFDFPDNYKLTFHHDLDFMRMYMSYKKSKENK